MSSSRPACRFLVVCGELALALLAVRLFKIEEQRSFFALMCLVAGGFLIHYWLPPLIRLPFFCLLSLGGLLFLLGWPGGLPVIGIGAGLIALCYLPVPFVLRVTAAGLAGFALAFLRIEIDGPFWPVLGSMFMFRLIVYLYELRRAAARPSLPLTVAYFFPLPNVSFLFFPVLDFQTFRETYRADAPWTVAQEGVGWIVRGLSHLLLYRVVKYYLLPAPHEITDLPHLALFLATGYALYLRVSGCFHIITGIFHLFGFQLPRTHHNYFLASSFTDIWRRINIYWKDFMAKVFFLPAFFALRGWGTRTAAVTATLWVFAVTWVLHSYQVFWLTGSLPLNGSDAVLWLAVGGLVAWNLQRDLARAGRPADPQTFGLRAALGRSLRIVGMFALVSFFWACWNTPYFLTYLRALPVTGTEGLIGVAQVLGILAAIVAIGTLVQLVGDRLTRSGVLPVRDSPTGSALGCAAVLGAVVLCGIPQVTAAFGPRAAKVIASLRHESATPTEAAQAVQGYYEEVTNVRVPAGAWLASLEGRPVPPKVTDYTQLSRPADDFLGRELIPGWSGEVDGRRTTINRLGMRDRPDRTQAKPPNTRRVAVVGSSVVMGFGVGDDETFTRLLEDRLAVVRQEGQPQLEVLNFGVGLSTPIQRLAQIDRTVFAFEPDAVYYVAHQDELLGPARHLTRLVGNRNELHYPHLKAVVREAGVTPDMSWGTIEATLQPHTRAILLGVYRELVAACRQRGILPVWVYLPMPGVVEVSVRTSDLVALAQEAGFLVVNLDDWADGRRPDEVKAGKSNYHPNALGHRLIAERLDTELRRRPELLPGGVP